MVALLRSGVCFGLLPALLTSVTAVPASRLQHIAAMLAKRQADNAENANSVCQKSLTGDLWKDGGYSDQMAKYLTDGPPGGGWPDGVPDKSTLDTILDYATRIDEYACTPIDPNNAHCSSLDLGSTENCALDTDPPNYNDPAAVTMLKAIANFANYMISVASEARDVGDDASKKQQELQETFGLDPKAKANVGALGIESGGLIMASGVLGAVPGIGGILAAPLGILIGLNNPLTTEAWEPKFDTYMDFQGLMSNVSMGIEALFQQAANIAINSKPNLGGKTIKDWVKDPSALPNVLSDGRFADSSSQSLGENGKQAISNVMYSAGVSSIWNNSGVTVVRYNKDSWEQLGDDPCGDEDPKTNPYPADIKFCNDEGYAYVLQRFYYLDQDVPGFGSMGKYGLDLKTAAKNSWAFQKKYGLNHKVTEDDVKAVFDIDDPKNLDPKDLQVWTLPVCDINSAKLKDSINTDTSYFDCTKAKPTKDNPDNTEARCWFLLNMVCRCGLMDGWPLGDPWGTGGIVATPYTATCGSLRP